VLATSASTARELARIDPDDLRNAGDRADDLELSDQERGAAYEDYAEIGLAAIPGIEVVARDEMDEFGAQEIDLLLANHRHADGLAGLDQFILVECKNWQAPVGAVEIQSFVDKLRSRGLRHGILIAVRGITGDQEPLRAANNGLARALEDERHILVIEKQEIDELETGEELAALIKVRQIGLIARRGFVRERARPARRVRRR
jgi:Restriction endonuclease